MKAPEEKQARALWQEIPCMFLRKFPLPLHMEHEVPPIHILYDKEQSEITEHN